MSGRRQRGASLLELALAGALFAALVLVLLDRLLWVEEYAEKTRVEVELRNMRTGLRYAVAELMVGGRDRQIPALAGQNPVRWLRVPPADYLGEVDGAPADASPGSWYFDRSSGDLVYVVNLDRHFVGSDDGTLRFRTVLRSETPGAEWVSVQVTTSYQWF